MSKMVSKKKKKRFTKIKKLLAGTVALVLVVGLTIAGTLAYLKTESNQVTNTFVATKGINLTLVEPNFDKDKAKNYFPGVTYKKDPILVNTSDEGTADGNQEWVMIRVDYSYKQNGSSWRNVARSDFVNTIASGDTVVGPDLISFEAADPDERTGFNANWIKLTKANTGDPALASAKYELYLYKYKLKQDTTTKGYANKIKENSADDSTKRDFFAIDGSTTTPTARTTPLFDAVTIIDQSRLEAIDHPSGGKLAVTDLPEFDITVIGAAVKVEADISGKDELDESEINTPKSVENKIVTDLVTLLKGKTPPHSL